MEGLKKDQQEVAELNRMRDENYAKMQEDLKKQMEDAEALRLKAVETDAERARGHQYM